MCVKFIIFCFIIYFGKLLLVFLFIYVVVKFVVLNEIIKLFL